MNTVDFEYLRARLLAVDATEYSGAWDCVIEAGMFNWVWNRIYASSYAEVEAVLNGIIA